MNKTVIFLKKVYRNIYCKIIFALLISILLPILLEKADNYIYKLIYLTVMFTKPLVFELFNLTFTTLILTISLILLIILFFFAISGIEFKLLNYQNPKDSGKNPNNKKFIKVSYKLIILLIFIFYIFYTPYRKYINPQIAKSPILFAQHVSDRKFKPKLIICDLIKIEYYNTKFDTVIIINYPFPDSIIQKLKSQGAGDLEILDTDICNISSDSLMSYIQSIKENKKNELKFNYLIKDIKFISNDTLNTLSYKIYPLDWISRMLHMAIDSNQVLHREFSHDNYDPSEPLLVDSEMHYLIIDSYDNYKKGNLIASARKFRSLINYVNKLLQKDDFHMPSEELRAFKAFTYQLLSTVYFNIYTRESNRYAYIIKKPHRKNNYPFKEYLFSIDPYIDSTLFSIRFAMNLKPEQASYKRALFFFLNYLKTDLLANEELQKYFDDNKTIESLDQIIFIKYKNHLDYLDSLSSTYHNQQI